MAYSTPIYYQYAFTIHRTSEEDTSWTWTSGAIEELAFYCNNFLCHAPSQLKIYCLVDSSSTWNTEPTEEEQNTIYNSIYNALINIGNCPISLVTNGEDYISLNSSGDLDSSFRYKFDFTLDNDRGTVSQYTILDFNNIDISATEIDSIEYSTILSDCDKDYWNTITFTPVQSKTDVIFVSNISNSQNIYYTGYDQSKTFSNGSSWYIPTSEEIIFGCIVQGLDELSNNDIYYYSTTNENFDSNFLATINTNNTLSFHRLVIDNSNDNFNLTYSPFKISGSYSLDNLDYQTLNEYYNVIYLNGTTEWNTIGFNNIYLKPPETDGIDQTNIGSYEIYKENGSITDNIHYFNKFLCVQHIIKKQQGQDDYQINYLMPSESVEPLESLISYLQFNSTISESFLWTVSGLYSYKSIPSNYTMYSYVVRNKDIGTEDPTPQYIKWEWTALTQTNTQTWQLSSNNRVNLDVYSTIQSTSGIYSAIVKNTITAPTINWWDDVQFDFKYISATASEAASRQLHIWGIPADENNPIYLEGTCLLVVASKGSQTKAINQTLTTTSTTITLDALNYFINSGDTVSYTFTLKFYDKKDPAVLTEWNVTKKYTYNWYTDIDFTWTSSNSNHLFSVINLPTNDNTISINGTKTISYIKDLVDPVSSTIDIEDITSNEYLIDTNADVERTNVSYDLTITSSKNSNIYTITKTYKIR